MSNLVAIAYRDEGQAAEVMTALKGLHSARTIDLDDAVAVSKDAEGRVRLEGAISRTAAGTAGGLFLGTLVGLVFFVPVVGALFGAAAGSLAGKLADVGQIDDFVNQVGDNMPPGSSAMLVHRADPEPTLAELSRFGGRVIRTTLPRDAEARIRAALAPSAGDA